jgi:hypothetical protein
LKSFFATLQDRIGAELNLTGTTAFLEAEGFLPAFIKVLIDVLRSLLDSRPPDLQGIGD